MKIKTIFSDGGNILFSDKTHKNSYYECYLLINNQKDKTPLSRKKFNELFQPYKEIAQTHPLETNSSVIEKFSKMNPLILEQFLDRYDKNYSDYIKENFVYSTKELVQKSCGNLKKKKFVLKPFPYINETIRELTHFGINYIVLTDASKLGRDLRISLNEMGLDSITDIISSKDVGYKKPDERFFNYALERFGANKNESIFLGHDLDELKGAYDFGLKVMALNYDSRDDLSFIPEKYKLRKFQDLLDLVK